MAPCRHGAFYIGYLRRKITAAGEPHLIHTRRGHGYILEEGPP